MKTRDRKNRRARERGSELLELALTLPLLLILAAGVIDFASAWNVRQLLANAVREGARLGSTQPMVDLNTTDPGTVQQICQDVANYLAQDSLSTTFMNGTSTNATAGCASPTAIPNTTSTVANPVPLGWTYYSTGTYGLKIQRTLLLSSPNGDGSVSSTQVTLTYPFSWPFGFNNIINWASGGKGGYSSTIAIQVNSTMANID